MSAPRGLGLHLLTRGLGLTRDMGVLQACRHLPLVHLELQGVHFVNVPRDSVEHRVKVRDYSAPRHLISLPTREEVFWGSQASPTSLHAGPELRTHKPVSPAVLLGPGQVSHASR